MAFCSVGLSIRLSADVIKYVIKQLYKYYHEEKPTVKHLVQKLIKW